MHCLRAMTGIILECARGKKKKKKIININSTIRTPKNVILEKDKARSIRVEQNGSLHSLPELPCTEIVIHAQPLLLAMKFFCLLLIFSSRLWNSGEIHRRHRTTCLPLRQRRKWSLHLKIHDALVRVLLAWEVLGTAHAPGYQRLSHLARRKRLLRLGSSQTNGSRNHHHLGQAANWISHISRH